MLRVSYRGVLAAPLDNVCQTHHLKHVMRLAVCTKAMEAVATMSHVKHRYPQARAVFLGTVLKLIAKRAVCLVVNF